MDAVLAEDGAMMVWWGTIVECAAALERTDRRGRLDPSLVRGANDRLRSMVHKWIEVPAGAVVRDHALRLLRVHALRAADALQLAAALVASELRPKDLEFVTLDARLAEAADREGFRVLG